MATALPEVVPRQLAATIDQRLGEEPVVVVQGPRTVGKSTLVRRLADRRGLDVLDLDDPATRTAVAEDPSFYVERPGLTIIDEYQHEPLLLDAIKASLNRDLRPGRFLLTGSTRYGTAPRTAQSLAGRAHVTTLRPLSQGELVGRETGFLAQLLDDAAGLRSTASATVGRDEITARVLAGGFPLPLAREPGPSRDRWFADVIDLVVTKDVLELADVRQRDRMPALLARLATQTAQVLNVDRAAQDVDLDARTAQDYLQLLEAVFLVHRLPAWGRARGSRISARPKLHLIDSGLAAHLLGVTAQRILARDVVAQTVFGHVLETFVVNEVAKQASWQDLQVRLGHYRDRRGREVDVVVEAANGRVAGIEVKASGRVAGSDLEGLRTLRDLVGDSFVGGVVLHLGERSYTADDRIHVVPLERLWRA